MGKNKSQHFRAFVSDVLLNKMFSYINNDRLEEVPCVTIIYMTQQQHLTKCSHKTFIGLYLKRVKVLIEWQMATVAKAALVNNRV